MDLAHLLRYLRPYRFHLIGALASLGLVTLSQLAVPRYAGVMVDEIIRTRSLGIVDQAAVLVLALFAARSIFLYAQIYLTYFLGHRTIADLRTDLFASVQRWSLDRFAFWQSGDAISRILQDTQLIQTHMLTGAVDLIATAMMLFGVVVMLFVLEWRLALLVGSVIPMAFAVVRLFGKEIQHVAVRAQTHVAGLASSIREAFAGALVIRAFTQEDRENARFVSENERATAANLRIAKLIATQVPVVSFLTTLGIVIVLWVGGRLVTGGAMTPGDLVAFLAYVAIAVEPAAGLTRHYAEVRQALGAFSRIRPILNERPVVVEAPDAVDLPSERVRGRVEFRDVSFRYTVPPSTGVAGPPSGGGPQPAGDGAPSPTPSGGVSVAGAGQWVLRRVRLEVHPGERVAVVGLSGAGKTTLVHLLPRFYDPSEGSILIDGIDIRKIRLRALRRLIGFVPQETVLFRGTVRENIAYARNDSVFDDVEAAARAANAHDFIMALPHGYETEIGEDGGMLSGGQRQRLAIARALLLNPRILILDEATSALDSESEALIQDALERAVEGRTTITIAHRLSTVRKADRIVVLDEGRIAEEGSHDSLLRRDGLYARLARLQWPDLVDVRLGAGAAGAGERR